MSMKLPNYIENFKFMIAFGTKSIFVLELLINFSFQLFLLSNRD